MTAPVLVSLELGAGNESGTGPGTGPGTGLVGSVPVYAALYCPLLLPGMMGVTGNIRAVQRTTRFDRQSVAVLLGPALVFSPSVGMLGVAEIYRAPQTTRE